MRNIFTAIANIIALDKALDKAVFGHELGLFGQNATEEEMNKITNAIEAVGALFNGGDDDEYDEYDEYDEQDNEPILPLIGKKYKVQDNSYITVKDSGVSGGLYGKTVTIVSAPYVKEVEAFFGEKRNEMFVDVKSEDSGLIYSVLFDESWVVDED